MARKQLPPSDDHRLERERERNRRYRAHSRHKRRQWNNDWMERHKEKYTFLRVQSNARRRRAVLLMYADPICCAFCGCDDIDALVLDHKFDNGVEHRKELKINCRGATGGGSIYEHIRRNGKIEILQILCANCNTKKHVRRLRSRTLGGDASKIEVVDKILRGEIERHLSPELLGAKKVPTETLELFA